MGNCLQEFSGPELWDTCPRLSPVTISGHGFTRFLTPARYVARRQIARADERLGASSRRFRAAVLGVLSVVCLCANAAFADSAVAAKFLCTDEYCTRYMVGTRGKGEVTTGSNHLGFRCVRTAAAFDFHPANKIGKANTETP
jgi:hypothetical protein